MIWLRLYAPSAGLINQVLASTGLPPQRWLFDPKLALASVMVMSVWKTLGYTTVIYLAALQGVPVHLYEASRNRWGNFLGQADKYIPSTPQTSHAIRSYYLGYLVISSVWERLRDDKRGTGARYHNHCSSNLSQWVQVLENGLRIS